MKDLRPVRVIETGVLICAAVIVNTICDTIVRCKTIELKKDHIDRMVDLVSQYEERLWNVEEAFREANKTKA